MVGDWVPEVEAEEGSPINPESLGEGVVRGTGLEGGMAAGVNSKIFDCSLFEEGSCSKGGGPPGQSANSGFCPNPVLDSSGKKRPNKRSRAQSEVDSDPFSIEKLLAHMDEGEPKEGNVQTQDSPMSRIHPTPFGGNGLDLNLRPVSSDDSKSVEVHCEGEDDSAKSSPVDLEAAAT
ncbi:hypothetical protein Hanom_Chr13g01220571 [Helianthus anomalus]